MASLTERVLRQAAREQEKKEKEEEEKARAAGGGTNNTKSNTNNNSSGTSLTERVRRQAAREGQAAGGTTSAAASRTVTPVQDTFRTLSGMVNSNLANRGTTYTAPSAQEEEEDEPSWWERLKDTVTDWFDGDDEETTKSSTTNRFTGNRTTTGGFQMAPSMAGTPTSTTTETRGSTTDPGELQTRLKELQERNIELSRLVSGAKRGGLTNEAAKFSQEMTTNREEMAKVQAELDWWDNEGYDAKANDLYTAVTSGEAALTAKRESGKTISEELEEQAAAISQTEQTLKSLETAYNLAPSEELAAQYNQIAQEYSQQVNAYNALYAEYEPMFNSYNSSVDAYNSFIDLYGDEVGNGRKATLKDIFVNSFKLGYNQSIYGEESYKLMGGKENEAAKYKELLEGEDYQFEAGNFITEGISGAMTMLGQQVRQWTNPASIAAGAAAAGATAIAGQAGPQVLVPEEVVTVPGAFLIGMQAGSSASNLKIEAGLAYQEMLEQGISEETAQAIALAVGTGNAALEALQLDELVKGAKVSKLAGADNVLDVIIAEIKRRSPSVANEVLQEVAQEGVTIAGTQAASKIEKGEWAYDSEEVLERLGDTAISSALTFGTMNLPGATMNVVANQSQNNQLGKVGNQYQGAEMELIETGLSFPEGTEAHETAKAVQEKLDAGETVTDADLGRVVYANEKAIRNEEQLERANQWEGDPEETLMAAAREAVDAPQTAETTQTSVESQEAQKTAQRAENEEISASAQQTTPYNVLNVRQMVQKAEQESPNYGQTGMKVYTELVNEGTQSAEEVRKSFQSAYEAGLTNLPRSKVNLIDNVQELAYNAGRQDAILSMKKAETKGTTIWSKDGGVVDNDYSAKLDTKTYDTLNKIGKATGTKIIVQATVANGKANGEYSNGVIRIAADAENPVMVVVKHELTHRLQEMAPKQYRAFRDYAVQTLSSWDIEGSSTLAQRQQEAYRRGGVSIDTEAAMDEIAANFTERILTDEKALNDFVNHVTQSKDEDTRTMGQKFFQAVREFIDKVKRIFKGDKAKMDKAARDEYGTTIAQLEKAEQLWKEAYRAAEAKAAEATKNATQEGDGMKWAGDLKYSVKMSFADQVDAALDRELDRNTAVYVMDTPEMLQAFGLKEYPMLMTQRHIRDINHAKSPKNSHYHGISESIIKQLPEMIENPVMVMRSATDAADLVLVTSELDPDGLPIIVAIKPDGKGQYNRTEIASNFVKSMYGRKGFDRFVQAALNSDRVLYNNKKRTRALFSRVRLQLPESLNRDGFFGDIVARQEVSVKSEAEEFSDRDTRYSLRTKEPPKKVGIAYKVFYAKNGELYPPMVANPGGAGTPVGVWLDADIGVAAAPSKTGRPQVKAGGKGTQGGSGSLAFRPGWHLGDLPLATQFARKNPETGAKDLFPAEFVWAECEYAMDHDYQEEAMSYGYTENGKFRHSYAGLPKLPEDGYYRYRTNPNPDTVPWVITGAMRVKRILTDAETDKILRDAGVEPMKRQGGELDLEKLGLKAGDTVQYSLKDLDAIEAEYKDKTDYLYLHEKNDTISIDNMVVKKEYRNQGVGTQILNDVIAYADETGKTITLTPTSEFGTKAKLTKWYKANGFVENKGRNADYRLSDTMYRLPKGGVKYSLKSGEKVPTFYSKMEREIEAVKQNKLGAASVVSMLRGKGVKAEEIKWSGIETFLEGKKSVTKDELLEFVRANSLEIEEEKLSDEELLYTAEQKERMEYYTQQKNSIYDRIAKMWESSYHEQLPVNRDTIGGFGDIVRSKLQDKLFSARERTPEGLAYKEAQAELREIITRNDDFGFDSAREAYRYAVRDPYGFALAEEMSAEDNDFFNRFAEVQKNFRSVDINSLADENAKVIQEAADEADVYHKKIQEIKAENRAERAKHTTRWDSYTLEGGKNYREYLFKLPGSDYTNHAMQAHWMDRSGVLAHARVQDFEHDGQPVLFVEEIQSDWHNEGAKEGYETETAEAVQAERQRFFGLIGDDTLSFEERQRAYQELREFEREHALNRTGKEVPDAPFRKTYHEFVLKNLLRKAAEGDYAYLAWTTGEMQEERWSSEYAEGYRIEYDQDIPKFLNKYGKQWGVRTEDITLDGLRNMHVHAIPVTEEMKRSVLYEGQPKFSLKSPVEETKDLIALHNLTEEKLTKALALGGFPMPSIAVTRTDIPHTNFGDITLVMNKSTIDPEFSRKNTVYSADAWTPTFPQIEYEADPKAQKKLSDLYYNLAKTHGYDFVKPLYGYAQYLDDELTRQGGVAGIMERLRDDNGMKQVYLAANGKQPIETIYKENVTRMTEHDIERHEHFIDKLGADVVKELATRGGEKPIDARKRWAAEHGETLRDIYRSYLVDVGGIEETVADEVMEHVKTGELLREVTAARNYLNNGPERVDTVEDRTATNEAIQAAVDQRAYEEWLDSLFGASVKDSGIYNNKPLFTNSGNRRSFQSTHYPATLDNIAKAMAEQNEGNSRNVSGFYGVKSLRAGTAVRFKSIAQMHELEGRLQHLTQEQAQAITDALDERLSDITGRIYNKKAHGEYDNAFIEYDTIGNILMEVTELNKYTVDSIQKVFSKYQYNLGNELAADIRDILFDVSQMPVNIFEAKPERAVRFDEVLAAVLPDNMNTKLRTQLEQAGLNVLTYEAGNDASRIEAVNSVDSAKFSLKGTNDLLKENAKLKAVNQELREQFKRTKFAKVDRKSLDAFTKKLLKDYSSGADINEVRNELDELYTYIANGRDGDVPVWEETYRMAYDVAQNILENASVLNDELFQQYKGLRSYLRTTGLSLDKQYEHDLGGYENLAEFRKAHFGSIKLRNDGLPVNIAYEELARMYPEFFNAEEYTHPADQLVHIAQVLDELQPYEENPYSQEMSEASTWLANDILERFFELPQAKPTFADKAERRLTEQKIKDTKKLERLRTEKNEKIAKIIEEQRAKTQKAIDGQRMAAGREIEKLKRQYKERDAKKSESQKAREMRAKILRHTTELSKKLIRASDRNHIPQNLQGTVAKLLECINLESNYTYDPQSDGYKKNDEGLPTTRTKMARELQKLYAEMADQLTIDPDLLGPDGLLSDVIGMADLRLVDMTLPELKTVWDALRAIEATIQNANIAFNQARHATIVEWADELAKDNHGKKERTELRGVLGKGQQLTGLDMMTPEAYFHRLGAAGDGLFRMLRDAQDEHIRMMKEVADFTNKTLKGVNVKKLESTVHTVKMGGQDVKLTTAQIMELYALLRREQAREHILVGGILPDVVSGKGIKKIAKAKPVRNVKPSELFKAFDLLTEEQKKVAEVLQEYASTQLSEWGNKAAMKVYNYTKFNEKVYWPIRVNRQEVQSNVQKDTQVTSIANKGMSKATKPHASNSVRVGSIFDTFSTHASEMATYAAWLSTMEDINRIRNYSYKSAGQTVDTVKAIIDTVHGRQGSAYLDKLLADLSNGVKGTHGETNYMSGIVGNYKAAAVGANLRVIIQQPTAILRAMDMIGPQYMVAGLRPANGWKKAKKYAPIAQWKDWGYFDINTGRQMKDVLFNTDSFLDKTKSLGMWGAGAMDSVSWGMLWNAVESETKHKHKDLKVGTEEFYQAVAERFNEIVDHTQVVDGILQRSQIMRSPQLHTKMITSFMAEPTKQYNMFVSAVYDATHGDKTHRKAGRKRLARTTVALAISGVVNAMAQAIIDAVRDDDKEKNYWEKLLSALTGLTGEEETTWDKTKAALDGNLGSTFNPLTYIPLVKDFWSLLQGYDVERMDMQSIADTLGAATNFVKALNGEGRYNLAGASANFFAEAAKLLGVPVSNLKREIKTVAMTAAIGTDNYLMQYRMEKAALNMNYSSNKNTFMDIMYNAYKNDYEAYEIIRDDLLKSGFTEEDLTEAIEKRTLDAQVAGAGFDTKAEYLDELFRLLQNNDLDAYMELAEDLNNTGVVDMSDIRTAMRSRATEAGLEFDDFNSAMAAAGIKLDYDIVKEEEDTYTIDDLNASQRKTYMESYGNMVEDIIDDFQLRGFGSLDKETANSLLSAAYTFAADTALEEASGGTFNSDTKWINAAQDSDELGLSVAEYIMLKEEYSSSALTAEGVYEAYDHGVPVDLYLEAKDAMNDIVADRDANGNSISGSKKAKIIDYLNSLGLTYEQYLYLLGTEYATVKKDPDYISFFGKE